MDKRTFLKKGIATGITLASSSVVLPMVSCTEKRSSSEEEQQTATAAGFTLPALPYAVDALAPYIDQQTMEIHHGKHHQGYTNKLNAAIEGTDYASSSIEDILGSISASDTAIRNNGGGFYNHRLFWECMSPNATGMPSGELAKAIDKNFGSFDNMKEAFESAALGRFGSGWAWLLTDAQGNLSIGSTANQDNPLMSFAEISGTPVLALDVWEHAYYLNYQNKRGDYVKAFWEVANWEGADARFQQAMQA